MPAKDRRFIEPHSAVIKPLGHFLNDDGVRAIRYRRAGKDPDGRAGFKRAVKAVSGGGFALQLQCRAGNRFGRAHRVTVHGRGFEGRMGAQCGKIARQHPFETVRQRQHLRLAAWRRTVQNSHQRFINRHQGHQLYPFALRAQSPDLPPDLASTRMPPISMPRSTALAMS